MLRRTSLLPIALLACAPAILPAQKVVPTKPGPNRLAPFVASPQNVVEKMLEAAAIKPGETVFDLGSGDGRVLITAAQNFGAKGVGIEISPKAVASSSARIRDLKLDNRIKVIEGDLLTADLTGADVVTLYLLTQSNDLLRPNLEKYLRPGARVVSHDYEIRGWVPTRVDKVTAFKREHRLFVYEFPVQRQ